MLEQAVGRIEDGPNPSVLAAEQGERSAEATGSRVQARQGCAVERVPSQRLRVRLWPIW